MWIKELARKHLMDHQLDKLHERDGWEDLALIAQTDDVTSNIATKTQLAYKIWEAKHCNGRFQVKPNLTKKDTTPMKNDLTNNVKAETLDNAKIQVGKQVFKLVERSFGTFLPKFTWYEKLFTSREKRELVTLFAVYAILHLVRTRIDHYSLQCLTAYINYKLQDTAVAGILDTTTLGKLLEAPTKL